MAIFNLTLDNLIERLCRLYLKDWVEGTVTGTPASSYINDTTNRFEADDHFNDMELYMRTGGSAAGDSRIIKDFVKTGAKIEVKSNFSATPTAADTYAILDDYRWAELKAAINQAIEMVAEEALVWVEDETSVTLAASTYEYDIPTTFLYITRITMADSDGNFYDAPIPANQYKVIHTPTAQLHFIRKYDSYQHDANFYYGDFWANSQFTAGRKLRIEGLGAPAALSTDASYCSINPEYVCRQAAALLHSSRIQSNDPDWHSKQFEINQARADIERARVVSMPLPPDAVRVMEG